MAAKTARPGRSNTSNVYPFALPPSCSDGLAYGEELLKGTERLDLNDKKYSEYYRKLGGLLRDQFFTEDPLRKVADRIWSLKELPSHYHIRSKQRGKGKEGVVDYYIYGYPETDRNGTPKAFNSPKDFFRHLLWILGSSRDKSSCTCKLCLKNHKPQPVRLKKAISVAPGAGSTSAAPATQASITGPPAASGTSQSTSMTRTSSSSSTTVTKSAAGTSSASQLSPATTTQQNAVSSPVPASSGYGQTPTVQAQPTPTSQSAEAVIFREGEIVWYKNNNAWRIGIVLKAVPADTAVPTPSKCLIKPLAHAFLQLENVLKADNDMRPFLAFSVPPVNMKELQNRAMNQIPWQQIQAQYAGDDRHKQELVGLEASKKAVVEIDQSFSTFNSLPGVQSNAPKQFVGGVFLGAERVSVNEAVRIRLNPAEVDPKWVKGLPIVMVLRQIYVTTDGLHFYGDVYRLEETTAQQEAPDQAQLPPSMLRERAFRNHVQESADARYEWVLVQQNQEKPEAAIRGRFYETAKLMVILDPDQFKAALGRGVVQDVQAYLNNRLESNGTYLGRRKSRLETLSSSVPENFFLPLGPSIVESY
ncbi:hypothetical protein BJ170DRAFT_718005 [Xylariales sp. AK1849]|nr:hypothetical protein BJ170DRAFT_718005 [Xylariales sp. AK1849]